MSTLAEPVSLQHRVRSRATVEDAAGARLDVVGARSQPFLPVRCNRRHLGVSATPEDAGAHPVFKTNSNVR
eukprot:gene4917-biopygen11580